MAELARAAASDVVAAAYGDTDDLRPRLSHSQPFDPRLIVEMAPAVARAAMDTGVARSRSPISPPIARAGAFRLPLRPADAAGVRARAHALPRIVYAEGEDERTLRAVQSAVDDGLAHPILIGTRHGDRRENRGTWPADEAGQDVRIVDFEHDKALFFGNGGERVIRSWWDGAA